MRGERSSTRHAGTGRFGSSPHARGTPLHRIPDRRRGRFIPACAGNAMKGATALSLFTVHPRMRGERTNWVRQAMTSIGSSPHARGTHPEQAGQWQSTRFIPACAGNAAGRYKGGRAQTVHPRMRGERTADQIAQGKVYGSSPHARGPRMARRPGSARCRFIPACAGNAGRSRRCSSWCAVHPRMRGERSSTHMSRWSRPGSSPHARGTLFILVLFNSQPRFIPACAGNA